MSPLTGPLMGDPDVSSCREIILSPYRDFLDVFQNQKKTEKKNRDMLE